LPRGLKAGGLRNAFVKLLRLADGEVVGNLVWELLSGAAGGISGCFHRGAEDCPILKNCATWRIRQVLP